MLTNPPKNFKKDKPLYMPYKSDRNGKVGMVYTKKGLIHFGASDYRQNYSAAAKKSYCARSAGIKNGSGNLTKDNRESPNYWSRKVLWNC